MNWNDVGFLISKNRYNENSIIAEVFTENHGKISGIIFGGTSKKIKNYDIALYVFFMKKKNHLRLRFFFAGFFVDIVILSSSPTHGNNLVNDCIKSFTIKLI